MTVTYYFLQTSNTDMYVNWDGFQDVEEFNVGPHTSGIKHYILGIGKSYKTSNFVNDVLRKEYNILTCNDNPLILSIYYFLLEQLNISGKIWGPKSDLIVSCPFFF